MFDKRKLLVVLAIMVGACAADGAEIGWKYLSSDSGALAVPNSNNQQTASLVLDIDKDETDDFVITERTGKPSVVWYKYCGEGKWEKLLIDDTPLHIEAGGDYYDIDADGDLDIVFCGDSRSDGVWWWENPYPKYEAARPWKRRVIKAGDNARHQHDNRFGDFDGDGKVELAWWSQAAKKLFLAKIPKNPRTAGHWDYKDIFSYSGKTGHEGMDVADINLDGTVDIVGAGYWFEHAGGGKFKSHKITDRPFTRCAAGQLVPGGRLEVVISPGDTDGPVEWFEWDGKKWVGHRLMDKIIHGHSLAVRDIDGDGHVDVFVAEMGKPGAGKNARTMIYLGDGRGLFERQIVDVGKANHESKLGDLDGDGDIDIIGKPYSFGAPGLGVWLQDRKRSQTEGDLTGAVVVVGSQESDAAKYAARELARFLGEVTGADFRIQHTLQKGGANLLVGPGAARLVEPGFSTEGLGADGIVIRSKGGDLILAGGHPRGTLYAVYTFLEDVVGCRWWSSKVSTIPKRTAINAKGLNIRYVPPLEYREVFWFDAFDGDWAVRNKSNGHSERLDDKRGGKHVYEGFVHTFYSLIPPDTYFEKHPEWFSEIKGKRVHKRAQLCLTNDAMRAELVKNLKVRLRKNPKATIASVSQNDWHGFCTCAKCAAIDEKEGSHAGTMIRFVNAVAEDIEKEFPNVAISTLAYQYTRKPPKMVRPRPNVIVRLCSIECSFSKPLSDERNKTFRDDIVGWSKICKRLYIWDYTTNFRHYFRPHPNLRVLGDNIRFFVKHGVKGIFEQGAYTSNGAEMAELRAWVLGKLLWNPALDDGKLIEEFLDGYYGPAGRHIGAYLDVMHDAVDASGYYLGCLPSGIEPQPGFLNFKALATGWGHLKEAEGAVADDAELVSRVKMAQLPVMYAFMRQWTSLRRQAERKGADWPMGDSIDAVYAEFLDTARKNNVTRLCEWYDGFGLLEGAVKKAKQ